MPQAREWSSRSSKIDFRVRQSFLLMNPSNSHGLFIFKPALSQLIMLLLLKCFKQVLEMQVKKSYLEQDLLKGMSLFL